MQYCIEYSFLDLALGDWIVVTLYEKLCYLLIGDGVKDIENNFKPRTRPWDNWVC